VSNQETTNEGLTRSVLLRRAGAGGAALLTLPGLLAACGDDDDDESSNGGAGGATGPLSYLNSLDPGAPLTEAYDTTRARWNKQHPNGKVTYESVPFANFLAAATTRARARKLEDTVSMLSGQAYKSLFSGLHELDKADFGDAANELTGWSGQVVSADTPDRYAGVPLGSVGIVWYYNKEHFAQAGLDPETPPVSWGEFISASQALKDEGLTPIGMSGADSFFAWWMWISFSPQVFPTPADVLTVLSGETPLTAPQFLDTLKPIEETYKKGFWNEDFGDAAYTDVEAKFGKGEVSMVPGLTIDIAHWKIWDEKLGPDKYGIFVAPLLPNADKQGFYYTPSQSIGISKNTKVIGSAREWCMYLTSKETQTRFLKVAGQFPNRTDIDIGAITGSAGAGIIDGLIKEYDGGVDSAQNQFNSGAVQTSFQRLTTGITSGDLEGFLKELQRQQEQ
jgi:multiple sugar transport system substrate-binding protein